MTEEKKALVPLAFEWVSALLANDGELTPEIAEEIEHPIATKVDNYLHFQRQVEAQSELLKQRAAELTKAAKSLEAISARLDKNMLAAMDIMGVTEIRGNEYVYKKQRCNPRLVIDDEAKLDRSYVIETVIPEHVETEVDSKKIKTALIDGFEVPGAHLEGGWTLKTGINKVEKSK